MDGVVSANTGVTAAGALTGPCSAMRISGCSCRSGVLSAAGSSGDFKLDVIFGSSAALVDTCKTFDKHMKSADCIRTGSRTSLCAAVHTAAAVSPTAESSGDVGGLVARAVVGGRRLGEPIAGIAGAGR